MSKKRNFLAGGIGLSVVFLFAWAIGAQDAATSSPLGEPSRIALVDVNYVFKQHKPFLKKMDELKNDADEMDKNMKQQSAIISAMLAQLQGMTPGSNEYKDLEERASRAKTDWTIKVQTKRRDFLMREAEVYRSTYEEIETEIKKFADEHRIDMTLRFIGDPVDTSSPESIKQSLNRPVVWYDKNLDITPYIIKSIEEKSKKPAVEEKPSMEQ
jgi:Skp family chaperone for outer membrane proteins